MKSHNMHSKRILAKFNWIKKTALIFIFLLLPISAWAEWSMSEPANTRYPGSTTWNPGIAGGIPVIDDADLELIGTGSKTSAEIVSCLNTIGKSGCLLRAGQTYNITSSINIPTGKLLRGEGQDSTILAGVGLGNAAVVNIGGGSKTGSNMSISSGATKGSDTITISGHSFITGDFMFIWGDDIGDFVNGGDWCDGECPGGSPIHLYQMATVTAVDGNDITIDPVIIHTFTNAVAREVALNASEGLEDLTVIKDGDAGNGITMGYATGSWVKNVETEEVGGKAALEITHSFRNTVQTSYFHKANGYGDGGQAYGVWITHVSSDNLVENNIFYQLRHSMIQACAGARNVFAYNYSEWTAGEGDTQDYWVQQDGLANHQLHPWYTLYEGNRVNSIGGDNVHGSGSHNVFFRNHSDKRSLARNGVEPADRARYAVEINTWNYYYTLVGNVLGEPGDGGLGRVDNYNLGGNYKIVCIRTGYLSQGDNDASGNDSKVLSTLYDHGNVLYYTDNQPGSINYEGADDTDLPDSLYLSSKPEFFGNLPWPSIGPDLDPFVGVLPAKKRYELIISDTDPANPAALQLVK